MSKRTLDCFFSPPTKRPKKDDLETLSRQVSPPPSKAKLADTDLQRAIELSKKITSGYTLYNEPGNILSSISSYTAHESYPHPIANLPHSITEALNELLLTASGKLINNQPHLDLLYFQRLIPQSTADDLFTFLRSSLPFYRVRYTITRCGKSLDINTPRYTTVFGVDETSRFKKIPTTSSFPDTAKPNTTHLQTHLVESTNPTKPVPPGKYAPCTVAPRPIPPCLETLKTLTEALTRDTFNFVLVNYYATGSDSISYHSDDERFLGNNPAIASFSLGARRDFLLKHKPPATAIGPTNSSSRIGNRGRSAAPTSASTAGAEGEKIYPGTTQIKLALGSGDMILMRGETQRNWLHSIPKRSGKNNGSNKGRINITMRKAMVPGGTENYYQYNVGKGEVYRWDEETEEMRVWEIKRRRSFEQGFLDGDNSWMVLRST